MSCIPPPCLARGHAFKCSSRSREERSYGARLCVEEQACYALRLLLSMIYMKGSVA